MVRKVLVAAPTDERHDYVLEEWLGALSRQTYDDFDVMLVYTGYDEGYFEKLKGKVDFVSWMPWDSKTYSVVQHLARCREKYRCFAVEKGYDYLFHLDTDILLPRNGLKRLLDADKDQVGFVVHVFPKGFYQPPCVFKNGEVLMNQENVKKNGLQYYSWDWVYKNKGKLRKVYATGLGVLLVKRKVFLEVPFRSHKTFLNGEDLWYYAEAHEKGFEAWCFVQRVTHKNAGWDGVMAKDPKRTKIYFAFGPENAKEAVWV